MGALSEARATIAIARFIQDTAATTVSTPLATFLYIYNHASHESYINYMEGAKVLAKYLAPIDIKEINIEIPDILVSYDLQQIALVLQPHSVIPLDTYQIGQAIYEHLTQLR